MVIVGLSTYDSVPELKLHKAVNHDGLILQCNQLEVTNIEKASLINHEHEEWKTRPLVKGNETINGLISPHNVLNIEKTEIKPEGNIAEKEPESGDEMEKEVNRTKIIIGDGKSDSNKGH